MTALCNDNTYYPCPYHFLGDDQHTEPFLLQEYFQTSSHSEPHNGTSYYGALPVQQAHSTTPHEVIIFRL